MPEEITLAPQHDKADIVGVRPGTLRVRIRIGKGKRKRIASLTITEARRVAYSLLMAADETAEAKREFEFDNDLSPTLYPN